MDKRMEMVDWSAFLIVKQTFHPRPGCSDSGFFLVSLPRFWLELECKQTNRTGISPKWWGWRYAVRILAVGGKAFVFIRQRCFKMIDHRYQNF